MGNRERLLVEIDRSTEPISGVVRAVEGPPEPNGPREQVTRFTGYIELITALERAGRGNDRKGRPVR